MADILEYKCPNCGGTINFDATEQQMICPYCDSEFDIAAVVDEINDTVGEDSFRWKDVKTEQIDNDGELVTYVCNSCGGEIVCDKSTAASACPFCGNNVVISESVSGLLKPNIVIPFKYNKDAAKNALMELYKGKKLLPDSFKKDNYIDEIKGIYVPVWLYTSDADANIRFHATKVRTWSDSRYDYTETSHFRVIREGSISFRNVPSDGSSKMPDEIMESVEPFDYSQAVDFQTAYLSGFFADKYDVGYETCETRANERIKHTTENVFQNTVIGYNSVTPEHSSISIENGDVLYAFLPVWMLSSTYNGKKYTFAMNGQTGKIVGDLPIDKGKSLKYFSIATAIAAAVTFAVMYFI